MTYIPRWKYVVIIICLLLLIASALYQIIAWVTSRPRTSLIESPQLVALEQLDNDTVTARKLVETDPQGAIRLLSDAIVKARMTGLLPLRTGWPSQAETALCELYLAQPLDARSDPQQREAFLTSLRESYPAIAGSLLTASSSRPGGGN